MYVVRNSIQHNPIAALTLETFSWDTCDLYHVSVRPSDSQLNDPNLKDYGDELHHVQCSQQILEAERIIIIASFVLKRREFVSKKNKHELSPPL